MDLALRLLTEIPAKTGINGHFRLPLVRMGYSCFP
jgi:hypothetical protein